MSFQSFVFRHLVIAAVCNTKEVPSFAGGGGGRTRRMMHCALLMANSRNFRLCRCSDSEEQRKMESRAKNKLTNKDNNNKTRLRELRLSLQLSPCCALPVSLPAPAEHLGEGGERYGGWGLKLVPVIQNFATLRTHFFVFFSACYARTWQIY